MQQKQTVVLRRQWFNVFCLPTVLFGAYPSMTETQFLGHLCPGRATFQT